MRSSTSPCDMSRHCWRILSKASCQAEPSGATVPSLMTTWAIPVEGSCRKSTHISHTDTMRVDVVLMMVGLSLCIHMPHSEKEFVDVLQQPPCTALGDNVHESVLGIGLEVNGQCLVHQRHELGTILVGDGDRLGVGDVSAGTSALGQRQGPFVMAA